MFKFQANCRLLFSIWVLLVVSWSMSFGQCQQAINGNVYWVNTDFDGGPGSLRQAILDANSDNVGGRIEINGPWMNFPINSPLPLITCDSLVIFDYLPPITIDGQNFVLEPAVRFATSLSCFGVMISGINFIAGNIVVTNTNNSGAGSLREAIRSANFSNTMDAVTFNIAGTAPHRIEIPNELPWIMKPLNIDGNTQPANGFQGVAPKIELDGVNGGLHCLTFYNNNSTPWNAGIYGLYIHRFSIGITTSNLNNIIVGAPGKGNVISGNYQGANLNSVGNTTVVNNYFGTDTSGTLAEPNSSTGISIVGATNGYHQLVDNLISANEMWGVIYYSGMRNISIKGNKIGTDKTGNYAIPNKHVGVSVSANFVTIGGTLPGEGNLFSGNGISDNVFPKTALAIYGDTISVIGNNFGTNLTGTDTIPNRYGSAMLLDGDHVTIGGQNVNERNIIAGSQVGIGGFFGSHNVIRNNFFGTDITGTIALPNYVGISLISDSSQMIENKINFNNEGIFLQNGSTGNIIFNNEIQSNQTNGIYNDGDLNTFTQNSIYSNGIKAIFNTPSANNGIAKPDITFISTDSVVGTSLPGATVELFYSVSGNSNAQGKQIITSVIADSFGKWKYTGVISNPIFVTATQTDNNGNTSEFSDLWPQATDNVWPGDCNYDLIVDNLDFIYLGMAFGEIGPVRSNASLVWIAQPATNWSQNYFTGVNHKHADTNGDGNVNLLDDVAINQNYGLTHPFRLQLPANTNVIYDFKISCLQDTIAPGSIATFKLEAASPSTTIDAIYGLKWSTVFDALLVDTNFIAFDFTNNILGDNSNVIGFSKNNFSNNLFHQAITRINHADTNNVDGVIGFIHLAAKQTISTIETLYVEADDILGLNISGTQINFHVIKDSVIIDPAFVGVNEVENVAFNMYPNPAHQLLHIATIGSTIRKIKIIDLSGRIVETWTAENLDLTLSVEKINSGYYFLEMLNSDGFICTKKLIISH
jgi:hypothetical protein